MKAQSDRESENPNLKRKLPVRVIQSEWIFEGEQEVIILHCQQEYRLRVTRASKLILTK